MSTDNQLVGSYLDAIVTEDYNAFLESYYVINGTYKFHKYLTFSKRIDVYENPTLITVIGYTLSAKKSYEGKIELSRLPLDVILGIVTVSNKYNRRINFQRMFNISDCDKLVYILQEYPDFLIENKIIFFNQKRQNMEIHLYINAYCKTNHPTHIIQNNLIHIIQTYIYNLRATPETEFKLLPISSTHVCEVMLQEILYALEKKESMRLYCIFMKMWKHFVRNIVFANYVPLSITIVDIIVKIINILDPSKENFHRFLHTHTLTEMFKVHVTTPIETYSYMLKMFSDNSIKISYDLYHNANKYTENCKRYKSMGSGCRWVKYYIEYLRYCQSSGISDFINYILAFYVKRLDPIDYYDLMKLTYSLSNRDCMRLFVENFSVQHLIKTYPIDSGYYKILEIFESSGLIGEQYYYYDLLDHDHNKWNLIPDHIKNKLLEFLAKYKGPTFIAFLKTFELTHISDELVPHIKKLVEEPQYYGISIQEAFHIIQRLLPLLMYSLNQINVCTNDKSIFRNYIHKKLFDLDGLVTRIIKIKYKLGSEELADEEKNLMSKLCVSNNSVNILDLIEDYSRL